MNWKPFSISVLIGSIVAWIITYILMIIAGESPDIWLNLKVFGVILIGCTVSVGIRCFIKKEYNE